MHKYVINSNTNCETMTERPKKDIVYSFMSAIIKPKVFVAMSGGVDSSVAAALLKEQGYDVRGIHILSWDSCDNNQDKQDAMRVAAVLGIPFEVWDFRKEYRTAVFDYMVREYKAGRTPNPDVMCNKEIKFGIFLESALGAGADFIATGHYVCHLAAKPPSGGLAAKLAIATDKDKDQSYFLWTLTQNQLQRCLFPIGDYLKSEVRELARKFDLPISDKKDSQGLCFVGNVDFGKFLRSALPPIDKQGSLIGTDGKVLGKHDGAQFFTIGQRHGLGIGGLKKPMYVVAKDIQTDTITVAVENDSALYRKELFARNVHWISGNAPETPFSCLARIRYRQPLQEVVLNTSGSEVNVVFENPQRAVAPGQSVVFYNNDGVMLGGGIIV